MTGDFNHGKNGAATAIAMIGMTCYIVCMTSKGWYYTSISNSGLWGGCLRNQCAGIGWGGEPSFVAARSLFIVSGIFQGFKLFLAFAFCIVKHKSSVIMGIGLADLLAGLTMLGGIIAYTVYAAPTVINGGGVFGYGFYFAWFGWLFFFISGIFNISASNNLKSYEVV
ncbi:uncharacterized protein LOC100183528 [Ciona intestinalis]